MGQKTGAHETEEASRTSAGDRISDAGKASGTGRRIPARSSSATAAQASSPAAFTCSRFFQRDDASVVVSTANPCTAAYRAARSSLKRKHAVQRAPLSGSFSSPILLPRDFVGIAEEDQGFQTAPHQTFQHRTRTGGAARVQKNLSCGRRVEYQSHGVAKLAKIPDGASGADRQITIRICSGAPTRAAPRPAPSRTKPD